METTDNEQRVRKFLNDLNFIVNDYSDYDPQKERLNWLEKRVNVGNYEQLASFAGYITVFFLHRTIILQEIIAKRETHSIRYIPHFVKHKLARLWGKKQQKKLGFWYNRNTTERVLHRLGNAIGKRLINTSPTDYKQWRNEYKPTLMDKICGLTETKDKELRVVWRFTKAILFGETRLIVPNYIIPGTSDVAERVDFAKAMRENPVEESIIQKLNSKGIAVTGSIAAATAGTIYRPHECIFHDLDFVPPRSMTPGEVENIISALFPNSQFLSTAHTSHDSKHNFTSRTYLLLNIPTTTKRQPDDDNAIYFFDTEGEKVGEYKQYQLHFNEGVQYKVIDVFLGETRHNYPFVEHQIDGKKYLLTDVRDSWLGKSFWKRTKDVWDYARWMPYNR